MSDEFSIELTGGAKVIKINPSSDATQPYLTFYNYGQTIGTLFHSKERGFYFEGMAEESAKIFFDHMKPWMEAYFEMLVKKNEWKQ